MPSAFACFFLFFFFFFCFAAMLLCIAMPIAGASSYQSCQHQPSGQHRHLTVLAACFSDVVVKPSVSLHLGLGHPDLSSSDLTSSGPSCAVRLPSDRPIPSHTITHNIILCIGPLASGLPSSSGLRPFASFILTLVLGFAYRQNRPRRPRPPITHRHTHHHTYLARPYQLLSAGCQVRPCPCICRLACIALLAVVCVIIIHHPYISSFASRPGQTGRRQVVRARPGFARARPRLAGPSSYLPLACLLCCFYPRRPSACRLLIKLIRAARQPCRRPDFLTNLGLSSHQPS